MALRSLEQARFVGLVEHYAASLCLLHHRVASALVLLEAAYYVATLISTSRPPAARRVARPTMDKMSMSLDDIVASARAGKSGVHKKAPNMIRTTMVSWRPDSHIFILSASKNCQMDHRWMVLSLATPT